MKTILPTRRLALRSALLCAGMLAFAPVGIAQKHQPAPIVRRQPPPPPPQPHPAAERPRMQAMPRPQVEAVPAQSTLARIQRHENPGQKPQGEHLAGWLDHHSALSPQQQQEALQREPGFHDLPSQTQQRMRDRLTQLNNMPPEQRAKILSRTEALEKLSPEQRAQVRTSVVQLAQLPQDRRKAVRRAFQNLRDLPPAQRQAYLNSPEARTQFSDAERGTLSGLISAEPYPPTHE